MPKRQASQTDTEGVPQIYEYDESSNTGSDLRSRQKFRSTSLHPKSTDSPDREVGKGSSVVIGQDSSD